jgi:hypothetical protein
MITSNSKRKKGKPSFWQTPWGFCTAYLLAASLPIVGLGLMVIDIEEHALGVVPFALLATSPLMHLFLQRGHQYGTAMGHAKRFNHVIQKQKRWMR